MNMDNKKHSHNHQGRGSGKTVPFLGLVALVLVVLVTVMLFNLPEASPEPVETTAEVSTTTSATEAPTTETATEATTVPTTVPEETLPMLEPMAELYERNNDVVGWVEISGTKLAHPVMFTPEDEQKYIRTTIDGKFSIAGEPFLNKDCSLEPRSDNLIIYGHNMYNGTAFATLLKYDQMNFWRDHPTFTFSTLYEEKTYEIFTCFYDRVYLKSEKVFKFYNFIDAENEEDFDNAIKELKSKSLYNTNITPEYGEELVTLVTCAYHVKNGRFVIVGREIKDEMALEAAQPTE